MVSLVYLTLHFFAFRKFDPACCIVYTLLYTVGSIPEIKYAKKYLETAPVHKYCSLKNII